MHVLYAFTQSPYGLLLFSCCGCNAFCCFSTLSDTLKDARAQGGCNSGDQQQFMLVQDPFNVRQTRAVLVERASIPAAALGIGALAWLLEVSANLYMNDVPYIQIHGALLALTVFNWSILDATRQGTLLAVLCGIAAPLSEIAIVRVLGLWHYPRADVAGIVSWTAWCYAFYTPALGNLARCLWSRAEEGSRVQGK